MAHTTRNPSNGQGIAEALQWQILRALKRTKPALNAIEDIADYDFRVEANVRGSRVVLEMHGLHYPDYEGDIDSVGNTMAQKQLDAAEDACHSLRQYFDAADVHYNGDYEYKGKLEQFVSALNRCFKSQGEPLITDPLLIPSKAPQK